MRLFLPLLFCVAACKKDPAPAAEPVLTPVPEVAPSPAPPEEPAPVAAPAGVDAMVQALSARDRGPSCEDVEAMAEAPVEALLHIVENVPMPPQAPMRAANCVLERHAETAKDDVLSWVKREDTKGLGKLVLQKLDTLPEALAVDAARVAVTGPLAEDAVEAVRASKREAVRAAAP